MPRPRDTDHGLDSLAPSEATPLLLDMARTQAGRRRPADLVRQWDRDPFVAPAVLDQRTVHALDRIALDAAPEFDAIQLAPVAPLGVCSVLAPTSQDRTLSVLRGTEVVSDPTNVLALECARRLRARISTRPRLCTVHQTLRAQSVPKGAGFAQHFRLFALVQSGRALPEDGFECQAVAEHLAVFDRLFDSASSLGCQFPERQAEILVTRSCRTLGARVAESVRATLPHVDVRQSEFESAYYDGIRVLFGAVSPRTGSFVPVGDTGRFDWVARLASNRKLRFVASGMGIQLFPFMFGSPPPEP